MIRWVAGALVAVVLAGCGRHEASYVAPVFGPELETNADVQAHAAMPNGERLPQVLLGVAYARGTTADWSLPLVVGQCYAFGYASDEDVGKVTIRIWDPSGRHLESGRATPGQGVFSYCPGQNGIHRIEARARGGAGHIVVVAYTGFEGPPMVGYVVQ